MFEHVFGGIECCACYMTESDNGGWGESVNYDTREEALLHLYDHKILGHKVPGYAIKELKREIDERVILVRSIETRRAEHKKAGIKKRTYKGYEERKL